MAHYLAELYSPKPAWLALDQTRRQQFFQSIGAGMAALAALGVEAVALGETDGATLHAPSQRFFAIWRGPDAAAIAALVSGIDASRRAEAKRSCPGAPTNATESPSTGFQEP